MKFLAVLTAVATLASAASIPEENGVTKRTSSNFSLTVYRGDDCVNPTSENTISVKPGQCFDVTGPAFGARANNFPNQHCVVKFWTDKGCSGKASTWYIAPGKNTPCFPITKNGGGSSIPQGVESFVANCATDVAQ